MQNAILSQPFDRSDLLSFGLVHRQGAGADGSTVYVYGARSALRNAATVFGAGKADLLPKHPKQGCVGIGIYVMSFTVDDKAGHSSPP
jgi:hypothetical protein